MVIVLILLIAEHIINRELADRTGINGVEQRANGTLTMKFKRPWFASLRKARYRLNGKIPLSHLEWEWDFCAGARYS